MEGGKLLLSMNMRDLQLHLDQTDPMLERWLKDILRLPDPRRLLSATESWIFPQEVANCFPHLRHP